MKKAIVAGATGYIGRYVVQELLKNNIEVLAIGRRKKSELNSEIRKVIEQTTYCELDVRNISLLPRILKDIDWQTSENCVFYNFAWSGFNRLTDGTVEEQTKNVTFVANSVVVAKEIGCVKFINAGSIEESYVEEYLLHDWKNTSYHSSHDLYAISKLSARNMCKLLAYLNKIDYVHTRVSVLVDQSLSGNGFVNTNFRHIKEAAEFIPANNQSLFDIIDIEDAAKAYYALGLYGKNKADYFIGSGSPKRLNDYFRLFQSYINKEVDSLDTANSFSSKFFDTQDLQNDTGLDFINSFERLIKKILNHE